jgi:hypothetical protein
MLIPEMAGRDFVHIKEFPVEIIADAENDNFINIASHCRS